MDDVSGRQEAPQQHEHSRKKRTALPKLSKPVIYALVSVIVLLVTFIAGVNYGENRQANHKTSESSDGRGRSNSLSSAAQSRWTSVGTVQEVSEKQIKVKDSRNETKEAAITKDTVIVDRKGTKLSAKEIKKDQRVIISGTKDEKDKNKLTATRIRIQQ